MTALLLLPVILSILVLAAHFLRDGNYFAVLGLLALVPLLAVRRRWVAGVARCTLWLGTGVWLYSILRFTSERLRLGEPWIRMAVILGGVALFTALSSIVFSSPRLRAWFARGAPQVGRGAEPEEVGSQAFVAGSDTGEAAAES